MTKGNNSGFSQASHSDSVMFSLAGKIRGGRTSACNFLPGVYRESDARNTLKDSNQLAGSFYVENQENSTAFLSPRLCQIVIDKTFIVIRKCIVTETRKNIQVPPTQDFNYNVGLLGHRRASSDYLLWQRSRKL